MDSNYILGPNGELYHWGTKGMKWGIRRYQNKDGSLTPAGKKRYAQEEAKLKEREKVIKNKERIKAKMGKLSAKKAELDAREDALNGPKKSKKNAGKKSPESNASRPKSIKDMTDDELREHINRMQLEKNFYDTQKNLANANPPRVSAGQKFVTSLMNDVVAPAAKNVGRQWLENTMKDKLGLNNTDPLKKLENTYKKLEWETKIKDLQEKGTLKETKEKNWDSELKRQQYEDNERKRSREEYKNETDRIRDEVARSAAERGKWKEEQTRSKERAEYDAWLEEERKKRQGDS